MKSAEHFNQIVLTGHEMPNGALVAPQADANGRLKISEQLTPVACGTKTVSDKGTPEALAATRSCQAVWVGAPVTDDGVASNTKVARVGIAGSGAQVMPLLPANEVGFYIACDDPATLFVKVGANGESVNYVIFDVA